MLFTALSSPQEILSIVIKHLHLGAEDPNHPFHFLNFCSLNGLKPDCRLVVLRQVEEDFKLTFYTDSRSEKVAQISKSPEISLLFYHAAEGCQVKIHGRAQISTNREVNGKHWKNILPEATKAYQSKFAPKTQISQPEEGWNLEKDFRDKNFTVVTILPEQIECLQLDREGHLMIAFEKEKEGWRSSWLVP